MLLSSFPACIHALNYVFENRSVFIKSTERPTSFQEKTISYRQKSGHAKTIYLRDSAENCRSLSDGTVQYIEFLSATLSLAPLHKP